MKRNKTIKILLLVFVVSLTGMLCVLSLYQHGSHIRTHAMRPRANSIWIGGRDGGCWIELVEIRSDTLRLRVYDERETLYIDADYISPCKNLPITKRNWNNYVTSFDGENLHTNIMQEHKYCMFSPAFIYYKSSIY